METLPTTSGWVDDTPEPTSLSPQPGFGTADNERLPLSQLLRKFPS